MRGNAVERVEGTGRTPGGIRALVLSIRLRFRRKSGPIATARRRSGASDPVNQLAADYAEAGADFVGSLAAMLELARRRDDRELLGQLRWVRTALIRWDETSEALEAAKSKR